MRKYQATNKKFANDIITFDNKILNKLVNNDRKKLHTHTDDIALAYIEITGYIDKVGGITDRGYAVGHLLDFYEYYPKG